MSEIREILKSIELHDSTLDSLTMNGDGSLELALDIDEVWNKELKVGIKGIVLKSVYEISDFKIDRLNIIGSIEGTTKGHIWTPYPCQSNFDNKVPVPLLIKSVAVSVWAILYSRTAI